MTLSPSDTLLWYKDLPQFTHWALLRGVLFPPIEAAEEDDFKKYDLTSKAYIFMKRLHQSYDRFMLMDADERDKIFEMEMKLIREEAKQAEENKKK